MYVDRQGKKHKPLSNDVIRERQGAFAIIFDNDGRILVTAGPHAPDIPELPGGGIDDGENAEEAVIREIFEETAQDVKDYQIGNHRDFHVGFYADDVNEYWDYHKQYFQIHLNTNDHYFDGKIDTPEGGFAWWAPLDSLEKGLFRYTDIMALKKFGIL